MAQSSASQSVGIKILAGILVGGEAIAQHFGKGLANRKRLPGDRDRSRDLHDEHVGRSSALAKDPRQNREQPARRSNKESVSARADGDERGRNADRPTEIPAKGWKEVIWRVYQQVSEDRVTLVSGGVTFFVLLALFPAIAAFVSLYGMVAEASTLREHLNALQGVLPEGGVSLIGEQLERVLEQQKTTLGLASIGALLLALWSANAGMKSVIDALNLVYSEKEKRSFIKLNAVSLAFTLGLLVFGAIAIIALTFLPTILTALGLGRTGEIIVKIARWPVLLVAVGLVLALIYRFGPSREHPQWQWVSPGSAFAAVAWVIVSLAFSFYAENFGSYNKTYGTLGAAIGFMIWMWLSTIVVLTGAELNAELEHQTEKDTTSGPPRPLGERGAEMADRPSPAKS